MKQVLLFGAGKSATHLIDYLLQHAQAENWFLTVADANFEIASEKIKGHERGIALAMNISDTVARQSAIQKADIVISMMPAFLHGQIAADCVEIGRHLLTASYVDSEMRQLASTIVSKNILLLCEMGLDPGIDHMSAMQMINNIHALGGKIKSFKSHCGGLVAPESDDNPWHYKISWNPRNIILAGKAGAHFHQNGQQVFLPYSKLYSENRLVEVPGLGSLSWYPNRDSISYESLYGLQAIPEFVRTTLRHPEFITGWNKLIELELTNEEIKYPAQQVTIAGLWNAHLTQHALQSKLSDFIKKDPAFAKQWNYLDLAGSSKVLNRDMVSAADFLQAQCEEKLALQETDRDMVVMLHEIEFEKNNQQHQWKSSLVVKGENALRTAMSKTVGLPLAIACKLILNGSIQLRGLHIPTSPEIYNPVLEELASLGIAFTEEKMSL